MAQYSYYAVRIHADQRAGDVWKGNILQKQEKEGEE